MKYRPSRQYRICQYCGAHLDHNEKCDCQNRKKVKKEHETQDKLLQANADWRK